MSRHQLAYEVLEAWQRSSRQALSPERSMPTRSSATDPDNPPPLRFSHREAYQQLIGAFFSEPNILLEDEDEPQRSSHRLAWDKHMSALLSSDSTTWEELDRRFRCIVRSHKDKWARSDGLDLYRSCKDLAHELVFSFFLDLSPQDGDYDLAVKTTDISLRGQFSLPVKFGLPGGIGETAYSRGLKAHAEFSELVSSRVSSGQCPFLQTDPPPQLPPDCLVSHVSTFSSSLVIKALTSYLTFALLQRSRHLQSELEYLLLETERLALP
ncbi:hypothetical protein JCM24511_02120 [Saitozyma sp. JCM 24511]|nr:hypothetical protein JCM24511_02120 [Saitozyma sp. JCM 24511]